MRHSLFLILLAALSCHFSTIHAQTKSKGDKVHVNVDSNNDSYSFIIENGKSKKYIPAGTIMHDCKTISVKKINRADGVIELSRKMLDTLNNNNLVLIEKFIPSKSSLKWEISITSSDSYWTTPIETYFKYPQNKNVKHWIPWADPRGDVSKGGANNSLIANAIINSGDLTGLRDWEDPLVEKPLSDASWHYGAPRYEYNNPGILYCPFQGDVFCIPMITLIEKGNMGFSFVLSLDDCLLDIDMKTKSDGSVSMTRYNHRLGKNKTVHFSMDLILHEDDWRSGLAWVVNKYKSYFNPVNELANKIAGTGAYSNSDVDFDVDKMKRMAFSINWRASFDFPYMGMFIPPVKKNEQWNSFVRERQLKEISPKPTSIEKMENYCKKMKDDGFHVLSYFNVTEFGTRIEYPYNVKDDSVDDWKNANEYLYKHLNDAMLYVPDKQIPITDKGIYSSYPGKPFYTWEKAVAMDPGVKSYQDFLINQAEKLVNDLPSSYGICIDRMDWTRFYNHKTDDGVSYMGNQAVGSLNISWKEIMKKLDRIFHKNNKVIFVNNHVKRIDQLRYVDGIFDEFTYAGAPINTVGLLCLNKTALGWMSEDKQLLPNPDKIMQKYLYMGIMPMCPFPGNDHSMRPSEFADKVYLDYGHLFKLLVEKEWVLKPNVIVVKNGTAKANIFKTKAGYTLPIVFAGKSKIDVTVNDVEISKRHFDAFVFYPGSSKPEKLNIYKNNGIIHFTVEAKRGCAIVQFTDFDK